MKKVLKAIIVILFFAYEFLCIIRSGQSCVTIYQRSGAFVALLQAITSSFLEAFFIITIVKVFGPHFKIRR